MRVSDYIAEVVAALGIHHVFGVSGGGSMFLTDSVGKNERLTFIANHHEQASAMAAEAYARLNGIGCCMVTSGPGGTNTITGVVCAWVDSIPLLFISGQVNSSFTIGASKLRQAGTQETDIVTLVSSITKYAVCVRDPKMIRYELEKAVCLASTGRTGPVWLDIPLDVQSADIDPESLAGYGRIEPMPVALDERIEACLSMLKAAKRPVLIVGYGVRLSGADHVMRRLVEILKIPVLSSWTASDMLESQYHIGHFGVFGDRAGNFTLQNADVLLIIGCRMSIPQTGYVFKNFAPNAKICMVDVDPAEMSKPSLHVDLPIVADAKRFISDLLPKVKVNAPKEWLWRCWDWQKRYPVVLPEYSELKDKVNSFYFVDELAKRLPKDAVVIVDQGTAHTCVMQTFKIKLGQRLQHSSGHSAMGYGLPGAIGAAFATGKKVTCIVGDGSLQMNLQELQTIVHHQLPITIFVLNNGGYLTIKHMQDNHFKRRVGSDAGSGVSCPDTIEIAHAYGIPCLRVENQEFLGRLIDLFLADAGPFLAGPKLCEVMMPEDQLLIPRLQSIKRPDGSITSGTLEDMFPFLDRDEFNAQMRGVGGAT